MAVIVLSGLLGIFLVPWFVPHGQPVCSASYTLGFNNAVASLSFASLLAALFILLLRRPDRGVVASEKIIAGMLSSPGGSEAGSWGLRIAFVVMTTLTVGLLFGWYNFLPYTSIGELGLDLSRLDLMALGMRPYRDFQYNYGPAMFYPAFWLYQLGSGSLSIDGAFIATLLAHWVVGLALLYYTVQTLCRGWHAPVVFLCVSLAIFNVSLGVGYTPLRFIPPIASLLFLHRTFSRWVDNGTPSLFKSAVLAMLLSLGSLSLSPEIGVATVAGIAAFFAALYFTPLRRFSILVLVPILSLGIAVFVFSLNYTEAVFSVGAGANNFPVFPNLPILFHVGVACLVLPRLGVIGVRERNHDGALAIALVVGLGLLLPAAFGRCDQSHVLFNGLGILILFLAVAVQVPKRNQVALALGAFILIHPVVSCYQIFASDSIRAAIDYREWLSSINFDKRKNEKLWYMVSGAWSRLRYGKLMPLRNDLQQLLRYEKIGTPFSSNEDIDRFLKLSGRFFPEYYAGNNIQVYTPSEVNRKIRDLSPMRILLVPKDHTWRPVLVDESGAEWLSRLLLFPSWLIPGPRREPYFPGLEIMKYITDNFTVVGEFRAFEIWRRNARR